MRKSYQPILILAGLALISTTTLLHAQRGGDDRSHYRVLGADNNRIAIVNSKGQVEWEIPNEARANHDIQLLPNGNILFHTGWTTIKEITPDKKIVWQYELTGKPGNTGKFTLHSFERLPNGRTMIAESGNQRIIEVDRDGKIVHEIPLVADKPSPTSDTRMVRSVPGGGYLVAHEADRKIREYDRTGKVVWEYALELNGKPESPGATGHGTMPFGVKRLSNGNTLIGGGNNNRVIEVDKAGRDRLERGGEGPAGHLARVGDDGGSAAERQRDLRQLPRRAGQSAAHRGHPRQEGRLDVQELRGLRQ